MINGLNIYKASAGSGKTYTLALNYLTLVLNTEKVDAYREILAMTFTNKAAAEMKERIIEFLSILSDPSHEEFESLKHNLESKSGQSINKVSERSVKVLEHMLHNYSDISILTLDKFIQQIIKSFAKELDFSSQFRIESNSEQVFIEVIDQLMELINSNEDLSEILEQFSIYKAQAGKSYKLEDELLKAAKQLENERSDSAVNLLKKLDIKGFKQLITEYREKYEQNLKELADNARQFSVCLKEVGLTYKDLRSVYSKVYKMGNPRNEKSLDNVGFTDNQLDTYQNDDLYTKSAPKSVKSAIDLIDLKLRAIIDSSIDKFNKHLAFESVIPALYTTAVINELDNLLLAVKKEQNILFFIDFNRLSSEIIQNEPVPFIFERTGTRYKHLMLDEFQDTSEAQWHNLLPLMLEVLSKGGLGLIVGDEKQAIYRWRNGNVEQFMALPSLQLPDSFDQTIYNFDPYTNQIEHLPNNYRSLSTIVTFNNQFFCALSEGLSSDYKEVYKNISQDLVKKDEGYITWRHYVKKESEFTEEEFNLFKTVELIHSALERGFQYKDIAIIVRSNSKGALISDYLMSQHQIPVISSESLRIDSVPDIQTILSFFRLLIEPKEKVHQLAVIKFYTEYHNLDYNAQIERFTVTKNKTLHIDIDGFLAQFQLNKFNKPQLSLSRFVHDLVKKLGFRISSIHIQFFLDKVAIFDKEQLISLNAFLSWWDKNRKRLNVVIPEESDAIKVMTVHKSKGLEFPVCILPFLNWKKTVSGETWVNHEDGQVDSLLMSYKKNLEQTTYAEEFNLEKDRVDLDLINMLYVAFTRAKEEMHIISSEEQFGADIWKKANVLLSENGSFYSIGQAITKSSASNPKEKWLDIKPADGLQIDFSIEAPINWALNEELNERQYGDLFHQVMSEISSEEDIHDALKKRLSRSQSALLSSMRQEIHTIISHPNINHLFEDGSQHFTERDLKNEQGETLRPDCIVRVEDNWYILEYKTGQPQKSHEKQLQSYGDVLREITKKNVELYLIYSRPLNVLKLN